MEGYSDQDCALLLGCTRESFIQARLRALERISDMEVATGLPGDVSLSDDRSSIEELDFRVRLATPA